jgi:hypothetical protein
MASSEKQSSEKRNRRAGIGTVLSLLIVAFGVYYFVHVQRKTAYFAARNLRILATVSTQIAERIQTPDATPGTPVNLVWNHAAGVFSKGKVPVRVEQLVRQVFEQSFVKVFDGVMIADHEGNVRWQDPRNVCSSTRLDDLTSISGFQGTQAKLKITDLQHRASTSRVILEDREFRIFSQPIPVVATDGKTYPWVIAGVISSNRFAADSVTVSYTLLISVLAVFLLVIFSLPFLKLRLLGELQRVRVSDIIMLGVALLCAIAVVTLICLDAVAYRHTRSAADEQLRRLASDIKRHVTTEIDLAYNALSELEGHMRDGENGRLPDSARALPAVRAYPFFEVFSRINEQGMQVRKWYTGQNPIAPIAVGDREYFRNALREQGWAKRDGHYVLEAIRSRTTGVTQAVMARRPPNPTKDDAVVTVAFPMLSLIDTVIAGDCKFVVIDDEGRVVFHSESQRNNVENFFVETDRHRALRAAVAGRQNEMVNLRYWGEDQRAFVTPIGGTSWTLVTFRSKRLLRTLNVETIMIAVMFLLIHAMGYAIFGALIAIGRPAYRAPWLWPNHARGTDYVLLIISYLALSLSFAAGIYLFRPKVVLVVSAAIPALALLLTYIRLRYPRGITTVLAGVLAAAASVVLVACTLFGQVETDTRIAPAFVRAFILLTLAAGVFAARWFPRGSDTVDDSKRLMMPGYSYVIGAAGLLVLSAVLPTAALYKAAYKIEMESFVKHGQLRLVQELDAHLRRLAAARVDARLDRDVSDRLALSNLGVYYRFFFDTEVFRRPPAATDDAFMTRLTGVDMPVDEPNTVPRFVESMLPQYSDHSIRMRELLHSVSADDAWRWRRRGDHLDFHSASLSGLKLVTVSQMPRILPRRIQHRDLALPTLVTRDTPAWDDRPWDSDPITNVTGVVLVFAVLIAYAAFIIYGAYFVSRKVFLVDLRDPLWLDPKARIGPALGGNMLIFAPSLEAGLKVVDRRQFVQVSLAEFDGKDVDVNAVWNRELTRVDREPAGKGVLIPDFDLGTGDAAFMELKLRLLESAIRVHTRPVVAITLLSPWVLMDAVSRQPELAERWRTLLSTFNVRLEEEAPAPVAAADVQPAPVSAVVPIRGRLRRVFNGSPEHAYALLERETAEGGAFLQQLGVELRDKIRGREEIYDEISERASMYYASLWATCTNAEKTVLSFIAADGFANCKDRHVIRRLLARGLIRRAPNFKVMNETFRRFVVAEAQTREVATYCRAEVPESTWDKIQKPLMVGLILGGGFFCFTQRELFDASFAVVGGIAGGIPAVLRLVGIFTAPREVMASAK